MCGDDEDIVISGISGRFPKSKNIEEFSKNLLNKVDMMEEYEFGPKTYRPDLPTRHGNLPNMEKFDANFFSIMTKLAESMDPQMRTLLEHCYESIVDAGVSPQSLMGSNTGVIIACSQSDSKDASLSGVASRKEGFTILGNSPFFLPNRISYALGLHGPSFVIDAACASTATALDCAYRYISLGLCDAVVVGACHLSADFFLFLEFGGLGVLAHDGVPRPFCEKAAGYVRSSAIGAIFLQKRKDSKRIYANVIYSMANNDGYKPEGQTLPSMDAQKELMERFYKKIDMNPVDIKFFEAHATGTILGDFQEVAAIDEVFCKDKVRSEQLIVGSVKSNMGHAEGAAGFSSIAKIVTAFEHQKYPPNINLTKLRDDIPAFKEGRMTVMTDVTDLTSEYIAMNSFGLGGSNVHVLFKQNSKTKVNQGIPNDNLERVVLWSGRSEDAINSIYGDIEKRPLDAEYIALLQNSQIITPDANSHRGFGIFANDVRARCVKKNIQEFNGIRRPIVYVYSGMGTQWHEMGRDLMNIPPFAASMQKCHEILIKQGVNLSGIICSADANIYDNILNSYLGIISIEIALTDVLKSLGVEPDFIIGHSVGEIACSYADDCLTMEETLMVALTRAKVTIESMVIEGSMAAIGMHFSEVEKILPMGIDIACHNSAQLTTISGPKNDVLKFIEDLKSQKIFAKEVACAGIPFHSRYIGKIGEKLYEKLKKVIIKPKLRSSKWITSTYGQDNQKSSLCDARYHADNLTNLVMFEEAMDCLPKNAITIEISPHAFLKTILKSSLNELVYIDLAKKNIGKDKNDGKMFFLESLGRLFQSGVDMNIAALYPAVEFPVSRATPMISPLIKWNHSEDYLKDFVDLKHVHEHYKKIININDKKFEFLKQHIIDGRAIIPGAFWLFAIWESFGYMLGVPFEKLKVTFESVEFLRTTQIISNKDIIATIMILHNSGKFEIIENDATVASGTIRRDDDVKITQFDVPKCDNAICIKSDDFYKHANILGYNFQDEFRSIQEIHGFNAKVVATNNWTIALDAILQLPIINLDKDFVVPQRLTKVSIDPILHLKMVREAHSLSEKEETDAVLDIKCSNVLSLAVCGGIEVYGADSITINKHFEKKPVLESYKFIPFNPNAEIFLQEDALKIFLQTSIDSSPKLSYTIIEINENEKDLDCEALSKCAKQLPMDFKVKLLSSKQVELNDVEVITDKQITSFENVDIIVKNNSANDDNFITSIQSVLSEKGFLLTQENSNDQFIHEKLEIITKINLDNGKALLMLKLREKHEKINYKVIEITANPSNWLETLKNTLVSDDNILIYSQSVKEFSGLVGFFKCLRLEYLQKSLLCFLTQDENAPKFDINHPFFSRQIAKGHPINVFKNGQWGSYYHLDIKADTQILPQRDHVFVNYLRKGDLSSLKWLRGPFKPKHNSSDALIKIQYSALNFKDVVHALGYIKDGVTTDKECAIGYEIAGTRMDTGERVMAMCLKKLRGFSTYFAIENALMFKIPDSWTLEDAATVSGVYYTVYHAYFVEAKIQAGKSILIHSGAGGVGQAALHVAFAYGLEVFTTVGTEEKRNFLLKTFPKLKPENIGNSRDISFKQMVIENTNGKGVDYVLNSLSGDKMKTSLNCLGEKGSFLEIGRIDVESGTQIDMKFLLKKIVIKLIRIDIEVLIRNDELIAHINKDMFNGIIKPITRTVFAASEVESAFRFMMTGNHIGKVLLKIRENEKDVESLPLNVNPRFYSNDEESCVIIGGLGGLGLEFCQWLVGRECRKFVLSSSRGISNQYQAYKINFLKSFGAEIIVSTDDITTESGCEQLLLKAKKLGPIGGIFNLAAVLQDAAFENQTNEMFVKSLAPKAGATKHLHKLSLKHCPELKQFVVFSSVSCGRGNGGQTNYGMGNSIMEEIIEMRHDMGLPAKAIQWGPIKDVGLLSFIKTESFGQFTLISPTLFFESLDILLGQSDPIVACTGILQKTSKSLDNKSFIEIIMNLLNIEDRKSIPMGSTLMQLGIDSLTGVELQQIVHRDFNISLTPNEFKTLSLMELEKKIQSTSDGKVLVKENASIEFLAEFFDFNTILETSQSTELLAKLNDVKSTNSKSLIIPGWSGLITKNICEMASNLNGSVYCLQHSYVFDQSNEINNINDVVNAVKSSVVKFFTGCKSFVLIGHSYGVLISLKLAKILEENLKIPGKIIAIDGSPEFSKSTAKFFLPINDKEKTGELIERETINFFQTKFEKESSSEYIKKMEESVGKKLKVSILFEDDFDILNNTKITFLRATDSFIKVSFDDYGLSKYSNQPVDVHNLNERHNTILTATEAYTILNKIINAQI